MSNGLLIDQWIAGATRSHLVWQYRYEGGNWNEVTVEVCCGHLGIRGRTFITNDPRSHTHPSTDLPLPPCLDCLASLQSLAARTATMLAQASGEPAADSNSIAS